MVVVVFGSVLSGVEAAGQEPVGVGGVVAPAPGPGLGVEPVVDGVVVEPWGWRSSLVDAPVPVVGERLKGWPLGGGVVDVLPGGGFVGVGLLPVRVGGVSSSDSGLEVRAEVLDAGLARGVSPFGAALTAEVRALDGGGVAPVEVELNYRDVVGDAAGVAGRLAVSAWTECRSVTVELVSAGWAAAGPEIETRLVCASSVVLPIVGRDLVAGTVTVVLDGSAVGAEIADREARGRAAGLDVESMRGSVSVVVGDDRLISTVPVVPSVPWSADFSSPSLSGGGAKLSSRALVGAVGGGPVLSVPLVLAMSSMSSSTGGDYGRQPLSTLSWADVGGFTGSAETRYEVAVPAASAGVAPSVALSYSSGAVDGFNTASNAQTGPVGAGWAISTGGSITREFKTCGLSQAPADFCDAGDRYSLTLDGRSSRLVRDGTSNLFRLEDDPYWKIELHAGGAHPDTDIDQWWEVTTPDGTVYEFGGEWSRGSTDWVPLYDTGVCSAYTYALCDVGWRWQLDEIRDLSGNEARFDYDQELNWYNARGISTTYKRQYVRASQLSQITYTEGSQLDANARVVFRWEVRCGDASTTFGNCPSPGDLVDTPLDLWCRDQDSQCQPALGPTFWSASRLGSIQTQVWVTGVEWVTTATHDLAQAFVTPPLDPDGDASAPGLALFRIHQREGGLYDVYGFDQIEAEDNVESYGTGSSFDNGDDYDNDDYEGGFNGGDWIKFNDVYLGEGTADADAIVVRYGSAASGTLEVRLDSPNGPLIGSIPITNTGGWLTWQTTQVALSTPTSGTRDVFIKGAGSPANSIATLNWIRFKAANEFNNFPALPPVNYFSGGWAYHPNRVNYPAGVSPMYVPRIDTITNSLGGTTTFTYGTPAGCDNALQPGAPVDPDWDNNDHHCYPAYDAFTGSGGWVAWFKYVVTQVSSSDTFSGNPPTTVSYTYTTPAWAYNDTPSSGDSWNDFRGHNIVMRNDGLTRSESRFFQGMNGDPSDTGPKSVTVYRADAAAFTDQPYWRGRPYETRVLPLSGSAISSQWSWYTATNTVTNAAGDKAHFVAASRVESNAFGPTHSRGSRIDHSYNAYGRRTQSVDHGNVSLSGDERTEDFWYATNTAKWILDRRCEHKIYPGTTSGTNATAESWTRWYYDGSSARCASPTAGRLTRLREFINSTYANTPTWFAYDSQGRLTRTVQALGQVTDTAYDPVHGDVNTVTNDLNQIGTFTHDLYRRVIAADGPNTNDTTTIAYDAFGRTASIWYPTNPTSGPPSQSYTYRPDLRPANAWTDTLNDVSGATTRSAGYVDGFGRPLQTQTEAQTSGNRWVTFTRHNAQGRQDRSSAAEQHTQEPATSYVVAAWSNVDSYQQLTFDPLGRVTYDQLKDGFSSVQAQTAYSYDAWSTTTTDFNGHVSVAIADAYGSLAEQRDYHSTGSYVTTYDYDAAGRLSDVWDPANNHTAISYDFKGRKTQLIDPGTGTTSYSYDNNDNLTTQTDNGVTTVWHRYDDLNRLTERRHGSVTGTLLADYRYDAAHVGTLDRARSYTPAGTIETHTDTFDAAGRPTSRHWVVPGVAGGTFATATSYTAGGQTATMTYPANNSGGLGETVTYGHDTARTGLAVSLTSSTGATYVNATSYDANGRVTYQTHGSAGVDANRQAVYHPTTGRITQLMAGPGTDPDDILSLQYEHDPVGNITDLIDHGNAHQRQCFTYDHLDRLIDAYTGNDTCTSYDPARGAGVYDHNHAYNSTGNLTYRTGVGTLNYTQTGNAGPHAVTSTSSGDGFAYDPNGNMTTRNLTGQSSQTLVYDAQQQLESVTQSATTTSFSYDATGSRVLQDNGTTTTLTLGGLYERTVTNATGAVTNETLYYSHATGTVAMRVNGIVQYLFTDHLAGTAATHNPAGAGTTTKQTYYPYGQIRTTGGLDTTIGYTGQRADNTGLMYYQARYYDPYTARFTQPDTIIPDPASGQSYNRYSYVGNNPINYNDPTGHCAFNLPCPIDEVGEVLETIVQPVEDGLDGAGELVTEAGEFIVDVAGSSVDSGATVAGGVWERGATWANYQYRSKRDGLGSFLEGTRFGLQGCPTFGCYSIAIQNGRITAEAQVALAFDYPSAFVEFGQEPMEPGSRVTNDKEVFVNGTFGPAEVTFTCEVYPGDGCDGGFVLEKEIGQLDFETPKFGGGITGKKWTWTWSPF